ncbi:hypothetical protein L249_6184, partial [Ophiocordyceps polyrhachis-furcata BCC 54312]
MRPQTAEPQTPRGEGGTTARRNNHPNRFLPHHHRASVFSSPLLSSPLLSSPLLSFISTLPISLKKKKKKPQSIRQH